MRRAFWEFAHGSQTIGITGNLFWPPIYRVDNRWTTPKRIALTVISRWVIVVLLVNRSGRRLLSRKSLSRCFGVRDRFPAPPDYAVYASGSRAEWAQSPFAQGTLRRNAVAPVRH